MTWPLIKLDRVVQIRKGTTTPEHFPEETFELYSIPGFDIGNPELLPGTNIKSNKTDVLPGDVLFSKLNPRIPRVWIVPPKTEFRQISSTEFWPLVVDQSVLDPQYLRYFLQSPSVRERLSPSTEAATKSRSRIKPFQLLGEFVPLPPLPEQRRIVDILDQADRLSRLRAKADAKAARILPAFFIKMFGDPTTNPMGWPVLRFEQACDSRLGKMLDQKQQTGQHSRPYLRNANVYWNRLDLHEVLEMDFDEPSREEFRLRKGDVLICEGGEVGRCAVWNDELHECYFQKALHRARPYPGVATSEFIVYLFLLLAQRGVLLDAASKVTFSHLTGVKLKALQIPVPPFARQVEFSKQVRATDTVLEKTSLASKRTDALCSRLLHHVFSGNVST